MKGFIEVHQSPDGNALLLNVRHIELVDRDWIYMAFTPPHGNEQDYYHVTESYEEIVAKIKEAMK